MLFCFSLLSSAFTSGISGDSIKTTWLALQEGQSIDGYTRKDNHIYCGEVNCDIKPMSGVDVASFKVCPGSKYAKDKYIVYYPISIDCVDGGTCGVCYCSKYTINNLNVSNFDYLGKDYATDKIKVFFRGQIIEGADGKSFKVIKGPDYFYFAVDKNRVYKHNKVFVNADPNTFYYDRLDRQNDRIIGCYVIADKKHRWLFTAPDKIKILK